MDLSRPVVQQSDLRRIPDDQVDPDKHSILVAADEDGGPLMKGDGDDTEYTCASCGRVLLAGVEPGQLTTVIIQCAGPHGCSAYSDATIWRWAEPAD
jgi:hypothetical protein